MNAATVTRTRVFAYAAYVFCALLPAVTIVVLFASTIGDDSLAFDFRPIYRAGEDVLAGASPYPAEGDGLTAADGPYVYPPLPALVAVPLTILPFATAGVFVMVALALGVVATLALLGVRDWRCYGVAFLWPPVLSAIQTGNVTIVLCLAAALAWRLRDRAAASAGTVGGALALKFFVWPVAVWLAATRRHAAALLALAVGAALLAASWAVIGFAGLAGYPDLLRRLEETVGADSYTLHVAAVDAGLPAGVARAIWLAAGCCLLVAIVVVARRGAERAAFVLAIAASLALTPIVWLHYFALLLVAVGLAQPRLGPLWLVPIAMVLTPGSGQPTPFETAWTLTAAGVTLALALREIHTHGSRRLAPRPRGAAVPLGR